VAPLPNTARLAELVDARLASVPREASDLLGMLAVREPLGVVPLVELLGPEPLEMLEAVSLLRIYNDRRRQLVALSHPLYGEIVRERLSPLMRRRFLNFYADTIESYGARRRADPLRVANARLDASGVADHALVLTAARLARYGHDYPQVERLARAALDQQPTPVAVLLLTEALHELGSYADAEEVLLAYAAVVDAAPEEFRIPLIAMRVRNLMWGLRRSDDALAVNRAAREVPLSDDAAAELAADEAMVLAFAGRPAEALDLLAAQTGGRPRAAVIRSIAEVPALILTGKCETALATTRAAYRAHMQLGDQLAIAHPGIHLIQRAYALADIGRLDDAESFGRVAFDASTRVGAPLGTIWYAYGLGRAALLRGRLKTARRWLAEMAGRCADAGFDGPRRIALSLLATCDAQLGDVERAATAVTELEMLPPFAYREPDQALGRAWLTAAEGDLQRARDLLVEQAELARTTGQRAIEIWLLHDVVRLGDPGRVKDVLDAVAAECEGAFAPVRAAHGRAAAGRAPAALLAVAESFAELGALLYASEAATAAAQAFRQRGDNRAAHGAATRAAAWAQQCEGASTPGLVDIAAPEPLTAREKEIAALAAERLRSKEIAQRLSLSVRTVDNHLQRIYSKLGVTSRTDLADAFVVPDDSSS
jgi:DNA-binding CsgD family transcriptional regulator